MGTLIEFVIVFDLDEIAPLVGIVFVGGNFGHPSAFALFFAQVYPASGVWLSIGKKPGQGIDEFLLLEYFDKSRTQILIIPVSTGMTSGPSFVTGNAEVVRIIIGIDVDRSDGVHTVPKCHEIDGKQAYRSQAFGFPVEFELGDSRFTEFFPLKICRLFIIQFMHDGPSDDFVIGMFGFLGLFEEVKE